MSMRTYILNKLKDLEKGPTVTAWQVTEKPKQRPVPFQQKAMELMYSRRNPNA